MKTKLVIQILSYNAPDKLRQCLKSLAWVQSTDDVKLIVVDNASSENNTAIIKEEFAFAELIKNRNNVGFASGQNIAYERSKKYAPEYILVLNPDTLTDKASVDKLEEKILTDKSIGIVGPMIIGDSGEIEKSINIQLNIWFYLLKLLSIDLIALKTRKKYAKDNFVEAVSGACMLIRTEMIKKTGLFDGDFFFYVEDTEFCNRALKAGWNILFTPDVKIKHSLSCSTNSFKNPGNWRKTQLYLSTFIYFKKCRGGLELFLLKLLRRAEMYFRILTNNKRDWAKDMLETISKIDS
jgi:GT2 family glycosyltransferase